MTSVFEITSWADVASFFIWTLAVCALAKAIFGSLPAAELQHRLSLRDQPKRKHLSRLNWELANRTKWDDGIARGLPHAATVPLTEPELESRRIELHRLSRTLLPWHALQYLLGCWACQTFWTAIAVYAIASGIANPAGWFFSGAAYSGAAVLLSVLHGARHNDAPDPVSRRTGCRNCGK
jgi:hypothetical protein